MEQHNRTRPSLPPISSLIEAVSDRSGKRRDSSPGFDGPRKLPLSSALSADRHQPPGSPRGRRAPTPELPPASSFDFSRPPPASTSPSTASARSNYYPPGPASTNPELYAQRPPMYPAGMDVGAARPPPVEVNQWPSTHARPPTDPLPRDPPHKPTISGPLGDAGLAQQRPLPTNFPPPPLPVPGMPPLDPGMAPGWQHHHYYPPPNPAAYPQTQERYICPTCNKPFSRPSSLKIHTYSHTGEKPYKCMHEGCGKYFSVRSNMKRHEKGCHGGESSNTSGTSPGRGSS